MSDDVRTLEELLGLGTYQGMTDAEIESIIEYKVEFAKKTALAEETAQSVIEQQSRVADAQIELAAFAKQRLNDITLDLVVEHG